ncbi:hypothetical protein TNCV_1640981 [Trichonephila clavipes]|nr:hypothetical protein TNCV_1640981 [Trichonephila clavipes]
MFGRGLLNLALGAELKSLPDLKEGETFRVSTLANLEMAVLDALSQLRSRKEPGSLAAYQWWEGERGIFHSLDSCLLILDRFSDNPSTPVVGNDPVQTPKTKDKDKNTIETPDNTTPPKNKNNFKKRKLKKDSVEDFVFPKKKTSRTASPSISEPVATNNSFSDLEEDKDQVIEEEAKIAEVPKSKPL